MESPTTITTPDDGVQESTKEIHYFTVSTFKLVVMSIFTFGIYDLYWFYRNWTALKKLERPEIMPFWRAFFAPLFAYSLFSRIQQSVDSRNISFSVFAVFSACTYFVLQALSRLPDPYWLLSIFTFVPLIPANLAATRFNKDCDIDFIQNKSIVGWNWLAIVIGTPLLSLSIVLSMPTFSTFLKAEELFEKRDFDKSKSMYEEAIRAASDSILFGFYEYEIRASYGLMLNEFNKEKNSELFLESRKQFEWVIGYLDNNPELFRTKAQALSNLANTYQQEAAHTDSDDEYYKLLEKAYYTYKESAEQLETNQDWQNLAYTYYNLGETSEWYGDLEEAIKWLEKAVELDKKYGFDEDLKEDSAYLFRLKEAHQEMLNKQRNSDSGEKSPPPVR